MTLEGKFEHLRNAQMEKLAREDEAKRILKEREKEYIRQGIPRLLAISYAKHGWDHATPRK